MPMKITIERVTVPLAVVSFGAMMAVYFLLPNESDRFGPIIVLSCLGSAAIAARNAYGSSEPPFSRSVSKRLLVLTLITLAIFVGAWLFGI
jgi:hypothetical protein